MIKNKNDLRILYNLLHGAKKIYINSILASKEDLDRFIFDIVYKKNNVTSLYFNSKFELSIEV